MRRPPRPLRQPKPGEAAEVVVYEEQVKVLPALDVGHGVAFAAARLDVPASELKHVSHGLEQHPVLFDVKDDGGALEHTSSYLWRERDGGSYAGRAALLSLPAFESLKTRQRSDARLALNL